MPSTPIADAPQQDPSQFPIDIDATRLYYRQFTIPGVTLIPGAANAMVDSRVVETVWLSPGNYNIQVASGSYAVDFQVDSAGHVHYPADEAPYLAGANTSTLTLLGYLVTLDATGLSGQGLVFANIAHGDLITDQPIRLLPSAYEVIQGSAEVAAFAFTLDPNGHFSYDSAFDVGNGGFLRGRDSNPRFRRLLVLCGRPVLWWPRGRRRTDHQR